MHVDEPDTTFEHEPFTWVGLHLRSEAQHSEECIGGRHLGIVVVGAAEDRIARVALCRAAAQGAIVVPVSIGMPRSPGDTEIRIEALAVRAVRGAESHLEPSIWI